MPDTNKFRRTHVYHADVDAQGLTETQTFLFNLTKDNPDTKNVQHIIFDRKTMSFLGAKEPYWHIFVSFPAGTFVLANKFENWLRDKEWHA